MNWRKVKFKQGEQLINYCDKPRKYDSCLEQCEWQEVIEFCINFEHRTDGLSGELNVGV